MLASDSGAAAENPINEAVRLLKSAFWYYCDKLWNEMCVKSLLVFIGDEGSFVQPLCCSSGREEEQTGWWTSKPKIEVHGLNRVLQIIVCIQKQATQCNDTHN